MENTTLSNKNISGFNILVSNKITKDKKDYYISYNNRDIGIYGSSTTALVINETSQFLLLNGNHTKQLNKLETLKECLDYFYKNIDKANFRSEHKKIFKVDNKGKASYIKGGY